MNTKGAIKKVEDKYEGWMGWASSQEEVNKLGEERDKIIKLLKRGEKYKTMWGELDTIYITGNIPKVPNKELGFMFGAQKYIMKNIKQKYFPEEDIKK